jgi:imidazolonepropionase
VTSKRRASLVNSLLLVNIGQLLTLCDTLAKPGPRRGSALQELGIIQGGAVLCLGGKIVSVGRTKDALRDPWLKKIARELTEIDCAGKVVLPDLSIRIRTRFCQPAAGGFRKAHRGASYEEIAAAGGGIRSSLEDVRKAAKSALAEKVLIALQTWPRHGTTTVEAKSGYGLTVESELKSLEAIRRQPRAGPEPWFRPCLEPMSSQKNFRAAHKSMLRSSVRR